MLERVVVVGEGAREHALAHKLSVNREVIVLGSNAGIARHFESLPIGANEPQAISAACRKIKPDLVVIGPETFLAQGQSDILAAQGFNVFGCSQKASQLETSKHFTKLICEDFAIASAKAKAFCDFAAAQHYLSSLAENKIVIKVDGLCAGKGVSVCADKERAAQRLHELFHADGFKALGVNEQKIIIEDYLDGHEVSVFGAVSNNEVALFCPMQDHKRLNDNDQGPNTGGMGAVGPLGQSHTERAEFLDRIKEQIFLPALFAMNKRDMPFFGLLYAGLMLNDDGAHLLEFNVRFGDPETQALLFGTRADIFPLLKAIAMKQPIDEAYWSKLLLDMDPTIAISLVSKNYPEPGNDRAKLSLPPLTSLLALSTNALDQNLALYFARVHNDEEGFLMAGHGRVLSVVARGVGIYEARAMGYELARRISFDGMHYRHDIGLHLSQLT